MPTFENMDVCIEWLYVTSFAFKQYFQVTKL